MEGLLRELAAIDQDRQVQVELNEVRRNLDKAIALIGALKRGDIVIDAVHVNPDGSWQIGIPAGLKGKDGADGQDGESVTVAA